MNKIIIQNDNFKLVLNERCVAESLIFKPTGEECLDKNEEMPFFTLTEERPYNNEIKLAHPNKKTVFNANRLKREGNRLVVGFELIEFEAVVEIKETTEYVAFSLVDFNVFSHCFDELCLTPPPVLEFRLLQLPIKNRKRFGEWLNVCWDDNIAINVLATSPYARIDAEKRKECRVLTADAVRGIKLKGCEAALIVTATDKFLDAVCRLEYDYDLPKGVDSRRNDLLNSSVYWVSDLSPCNVDEHIANAKKGNFRMMLVFYTSLFYERNGYALCGNYDFKDEYPNGSEDLKNVINKIKASGIIPGIHFLHTHIGKSSRYITPVADHRLNLTRHFTLSKELDVNDTVIYVEENPEGAVLHEKCRVLRFGGELIYYDSYSCEFPYKFEGCVRGYWDTNVCQHSIGTIGGILDISEFGASSVYINQNSSLQDEIAEKLANVYNCGFEFVYFDGSEGTNSPFEFHVPNAQYRVYKKFKKEPIFCEGAAKSHFSWHMLSGGNAFDVFPSDKFKEMIAKHPLVEAEIMTNDFTRVDFGWWKYYFDAQPDLYEYATSRAAAWDCQATLMASINYFKNNPRHEDVFEVIRRWEDVRHKKLLSVEQKIILRNPSQEHILLINENNDYELVPYDQIVNVASGDQRVKAFVFERKGRSYVVCWHTSGSGELLLPFVCDTMTYEQELGGEKLPIKIDNSNSVITIAGRRYFSCECSRSELITAFNNAEIIN